MELIVEMWSSPKQPNKASAKRADRFAINGYNLAGLGQPSAAIILDQFNVTCFFFDYFFIY